MKILVLILCLVPFLARSQALFLPDSENTTKSDAPVYFAEHNNSFYFCGIKDNGINASEADSLTGFCFKTNANGRVTDRFNIDGLLGSENVSVNAIGFKSDHLFVVGATGYYDPVDLKKHINNLFVMKLDTNLNLIKIDTFFYGQNATASISGGWQTCFLQDKIVIGYGSQLNYSASTVHSYLTMYDYNVNLLKHREVDSAFLSRPSASRYNEIKKLSKCTDTSFVVMMYHYFPLPGGGAASTFTSCNLIDTSLHVMEVIDSMEYKNSVPSNKGVIAFYASAVRSESGSYYLGPVVSTDSGGRIGLSKMNHFSDSIRTKSVLPGYAYQDFAESLPAFNKSVVLLNNKREVAVLGTAFFSHIKIGKYDTSLNLIWHRAFSKPNVSFLTVGIHELQNSNLMVLASSYDYTNATTASKNRDFYVFILDSAGTPLNTFTVPSPSQQRVSLYPNPTQHHIRFSLPNNTASATYRITDLQGRLLVSGTYSSGNEVSVEALPSAHYLYQVHTADGITHSGLFTKQ